MPSLLDPAIEQGTRECLPAIEFALKCYHAQTLDEPALSHLTKGQTFVWHGVLWLLLVHNALRPSLQQAAPINDQ